MNERQQRRLAELIERLKTLNEVQREEFIVMLGELAEAKGEALEQGLRTLEAAVRRAYEQSFITGAQAQAAIGGGLVSAVLVRAGRVLAGKLASQIKDRANGVTKRGKLYARTYSAVLANETTYRGARRGMEGQARGEGKRQKMFVRMGPVSEPRAHSSLEGSIIGIDELWNIGGTRVSEPGHEDLPRSERINCQHGVVYL